MRKLAIGLILLASLPLVGMAEEPATDAQNVPAPVAAPVVPPAAPVVPPAAPVVPPTVVEIAPTVAPPAAVTPPPAPPAPPNAYPPGYLPWQPAQGK